MMALDDVVDTYCTAWNTTDVGDRGRLLRVAWTADCRYSEPLVYDLDRPALVAHIGTLREKFPGSVIRRTERKSQVEGKSVSVRVDIGGRRCIKKQQKK